MPRIKESVRIENLRFSIVLDYVLFPIEFREFTRVLESEGYRIPRGLPAMPPPPARITFSGLIGEKKDHSVHIDSYRQIVTIEGKTINIVLDSFDELTEMIRRDLGVNLDKKMKYCELIAKIYVKSGKSPISRIQEVFKDNKILSQFNHVLQEDTNLFSIRIVPKNKSPESRNYFDITIEPQILKATNTYFINVIYRKKYKSKVMDFTRRLNTTILKLIEIIDSRYS